MDATLRLHELRLIEVKRKREAEKGKEKVHEEGKPWFREDYEEQEGEDAPWPPLLWKDTPHDGARVFMGGMEVFDWKRLMTEAQARGILSQVDRADLTDVQVFSAVRRLAGPSQAWFDRQASLLMPGPESSTTARQEREAVEFWTTGPTDDLKNAFRFDVGVPEMLRLAPVARERQGWQKKKRLFSMEEYARRLERHKASLNALWERLPRIDTHCVLFSGRIDPSDQLDAGMYQALFNHLQADRLKMEGPRQSWVTAWPTATSWKYQVATGFSGSIRKAVGDNIRPAIEPKARYLIDAVPIPAMLRQYGLVLRLHLTPGQRALWVGGIHAERDRNRGDVIVYRWEVHDESEILLPPFLELEIQRIVPMHLKTQGAVDSVLMIDVSVAQASRASIDYTRFWPGGPALRRKPTWVLLSRVLPDPAEARREPEADRPLYAVVHGQAIQELYWATAEAVAALDRMASERRWPRRLGLSAGDRHAGESLMMDQFTHSGLYSGAWPDWTRITDREFPLAGQLIIRNEADPKRGSIASYRMWVFASHRPRPTAYDAYRHPLWP